ncbi:MAG: LysR family transcriptional regulator [Rhizobiaceae bacterium]
MDTRRIPSLNWLRVFEAAARMENFTRAAEILNMSAPAVSQQILALETHLGQKLFQRSPQKVILTDAGRAFLPVVQQSLGSVETAAAALFGTAGQQIVTLQAVTILAMGWLPARIAAFETAHPDIRVSVTTGNTLADFRGLQPGREPDLQIVFGSTVDFPASAVRLFGETLIPVAAPDIAKNVKKPGDLANHRLIEVATHRSGWHQVLAATTQADIGTMDFTFADNTPLALMMAQQKLGLALARAPGSDAMVDALGLVQIGLVPQVLGMQHYHVITPEARPLSRAARMLLDWLLEQRE